MDSLDSWIQYSVQYWDSGLKDYGGKKRLVTDPKKRALKFRFNTTDIPASSVHRGGEKLHHQMGNYGIYNWRF